MHIKTRWITKFHVILRIWLLIHFLEYREVYLIFIQLSEAPRRSPLAHSILTLLPNYWLLYNVTSCRWILFRADSRLVPSQWETSLQCIQCKLCSGCLWRRDLLSYNSRHQAVACMTMESAYQLPSWHQMSIWFIVIMLKPAPYSFKT